MNKTYKGNMYQVVETIVEKYLLCNASVLG